jgi:hypothetical protein
MQRCSSWSSRIIRNLNFFPISCKSLSLVGFSILTAGEIVELELTYLCMLDFGGESLATISRNRISGKTIGAERDILPSGFRLSEVLRVFTETARFLSRLHNTGMVSL